MGARRQLGRVRRLVVKVGSGLDHHARRRAPIAAASPRSPPTSPRVREDRREVVLVTSGAIATGMARLALHAAAALDAREAGGGGGRASRRSCGTTSSAFKRHGIRVGQVLLTAQDISDRARYLNARNTLLALLDFGVLPIVNENDTVAVEEIKVGDNDNLSALVASLIDADLLVLLTDVDGLYTANPAVHDAAAGSSTRSRRSPTRSRRLVVGGRGSGSVGGMATKLQAAQKAAAAGVPMIIANGRDRGVAGPPARAASRWGPTSRPRPTASAPASAGSPSRFRPRGV